MDNMVPASFSATPTPPNQNGQAGVLVEDFRAPYEAWSDSIVNDPAFYSADTIAEQSGILEAELSTGLIEEKARRADPEFAVGESLLPGFETLTWSDLDRAARSDCAVGWCVHQGLPVHSDGFDPDPDQAPHRSVEHTVRAIHGGEGIDRTGHAEVTVQLEQDRDQRFGSTVTLSVVVRGIEQYAWLTLPETRALRHVLDHLLAEAEK